MTDGAITADKLKLVLTTKGLLFASRSGGLEKAPQNKNRLG